MLGSRGTRWDCRHVGDRLATSFAIARPLIDRTWEADGLELLDMLGLVHHLVEYFVVIQQGWRFVSLQPPSPSLPNLTLLRARWPQ